MPHEWRHGAQQASDQTSRSLALGSWTGRHQTALVKWAAREKGRVRGTCRECGFSRSGLRWRPIRLAREASTDPFEALAAYLRTTEYYRHCDVIFDGKIVDVRRETARGFAIGHVVMEGVGGYRGKMEVTFQNENLVARLDGRTRAIVPDLVCICDSETAEPITTDGLRYGQRVRVMAVSAPPILRTPEALEIVGPQCFGLDEPFHPLEELG